MDDNKLSKLTKKYRPERETEKPEDRFCVRCKYRTGSEPGSEEIKLNSNGIAFMTSICTVCGLKKTTFIKHSERTEEIKEQEREVRKKRYIEKQQAKEDGTSIRSKKTRQSEEIKEEKRDLIKSIRSLQKSIDLVNKRISEVKDERHKDLLRDKSKILEDQRQIMLSELNKLLDEPIS